MVPDEACEHPSHAEICRLYNILPLSMFLGTLADSSDRDGPTDRTPCCASCLAATRERLSLFHDLVAAHRIGHRQGRVPDLPKNLEAMNRLCNIWLFKRHNSGGAETGDDSQDGTMVISPPLETRVHPA